MAAVLAQNAASAGVPGSVVASTISTANLFAAAPAAASGLVSFKVAALAEEVLKAMMMSKLKAVVALVLVLGFLVTGATVLCCRTAAAQGDQPPAAEDFEDELFFKGRDVRTGERNFDVGHGERVAERARRNLGPFLDEPRATERAGSADAY